ncbi:MAG: translation initiation factor IF-3 [Candidatus Shikimatogenerans sp. AspAUS03]|uniref:Translation initiation factor IF-3 n=1 Tax=Candidatus Shikimatogenerans sp. AspAUS03 TaxID=3158563 RepID=A0AAU7QT17_9FLAO
MSFIVINNKNYKKYKLVNLVNNKIKTGILSTKYVLKLSQKMNLDLVIVNLKVNPIIVKMLNLSKYLYKINKKKNKNKNKNKSNKLKILKINPNIFKNDLINKINKILFLLKKKYSIKINMFFRGRTILYSQKGKKILKYIINKIKNKCLIIKPLIMKSKNMYIIISYKK